MEETLVRYEDFLLAKFGEEKFKEFKSILSETGAMIAGGSVLHYLINKTEEYTGDIDIYVNIKNAEEIRNFLANLPNTLIEKSRTINRYNKNFLQINKINTIVKFKSDEDSFDLMYIRNSKSVEDVVTNFDFTCCQTYYDGKSVKTTDLELTLKMKYKITKDFAKFYKNPDKYGKRRLDKYKDKGFRKVKIDSVESTESTDNSNDILNIYEYIFNWTFNYNNFVTDCNLNKYYKHFVFNKQTTLKIDSPFVIKRNKHIFCCDLLDDEDFNSLEAYRSKFDEFEYQEIEDNIRIAYKQLKNLLNLSKLNIKNIKLNYLKKINTLVDILEKEFNVDFLTKYEYTVKIPLENINMDVFEYLNISSDHIVIFDFDFNKFYGYKTTQISQYLRLFYKEDKYRTIEMYQFNTDSFISGADIKKVQEGFFQIYELVDSNINVKILNMATPRKLKNLYGISVEKMLKKLNF